MNQKLLIVAFVFILTLAGGVTYLALMKAPPEAGGIPISDAHAHFYYGNPSYIDEWISEMDKNNVRKTVLFAGTGGSYTGQEDVDIQKILDAYNKYPDRTFPILSGFDPQDENSVGYLENQLSTGKWKGIGEMYMITEWLPSYKTRADHPVMLRIYGVLENYDVPIFAHYEMWEQGDADALYGVLENHPSLKFVWLHLGAGSAFELDNALAKYPNLYIQFDPSNFSTICSTPSFDSLSQEYIDLFEKYPDRFMVGTDIACGADGHIDSAAFENVISTHRRLISQLTPTTAEKIGYKNLEGLVG